MPITNSSKDILSSVTLADTTPLQGCLECLEALNIAGPIQVETYLMDCISLRGFNFLRYLNPEKILFFNKNDASLEFFKLIVELIQMSETPEEFISRIFSRSIDSFLKEDEYVLPFSQIAKNKKFCAYLLENKFLNEYNQWVYLERPKEEDLNENTKEKLSEEGRRRYETFLTPYQRGLVLFRKAACRRLLPCWPIKEKVPFSQGSPLAENKDRELEPSTNVFFYGYGWLESLESFTKIKRLISALEVTFLEADFYEDALNKLFRAGTNLAVYVDDVITKEQKWIVKLEELRQMVVKSGYTLHLFSSDGAHKSYP